MFIKLYHNYYCDIKLKSDVVNHYPIPTIKKQFETEINKYRAL